MAKPIAAERRPRPFHDLREYMSAVKAMGHLNMIEGADGELEIGALTGMIGARRTVPSCSSTRSKVIPAARG